jgi:hypothetical protein
MSLVKPIALSLGLVMSLAIGAQAQTVSGTIIPGPSVASLPPSEPMPGPRASSSGAIRNTQEQPVAESGKLLGPDPGAGWYRQEQHTQAVQPSPQFEGPKPN